MRIAFARALAVSAVALSSAGPVGAGTNQFTLIGPEGGFIRQVQFHPSLPGVAYALTNGGYYRTTDAGLHWQLVGGNLDLQFSPEDLAVDPSDPSRVLVAAPGRAPLVSTDAGATLAQVGNYPLDPADLRHVEFSADGSVVYGASNNRIVRSMDSGRTWSLRTTVTANATSTLQFLRVDPLDPDVVYVYDLNQGGFRSVDGGGSWQPLAMPANTADLVITTAPQSIWLVSSSTGVHRSTNGGATFPPVPGTPSGTVALGLDPLNQATVYVSTTAGVFRTPDGSTWTNVTDGTRMGLINSIAVNPLAPTNLMLGGTYGLFAGTPAAMGTGGDWGPRQQGIRAANAGTMSAAGGRIYIQTFDAGVHFLADGVPGMAPVDNEELQQLQTFSSQATTFGLLAQARSTDRLFVGMAAGYARSDNGGDSWSLGNVDGSNVVLHFADSPANPELILAATSNAVHRSTDGGDTWQPVTAGLPAQPQVSALMFASASPNIVYAGTQANGVYKSPDGGVSWSAANAGFETSGIRALAIDATNAQIAYAAAHPDLLKSTDGGASWSRLDAPTSSTGALAVASDPIVPGIVYVAGFNNFARSVDAGATWQALRAESATPEWVVNALLADPRRAGTLLASTIRHGVTQITVAPNLALESQAPPVSPLGIAVPATYLYRLRNIGPFHATGARVVVTLPAGANGITATTTEGACAVQATTVTCVTPVLEEGTSVDVVVNAAHPAAGTVEVLAVASGDQSDPQAQNNEVRHTIDVQQMADMAITVTGPLATTTNTAVTYAYTVTNSGPNEAAAATASITLPNGMSAPSATTTRGTCAVGGLVVNCTLGNVPNGASTAIAVTASTPASGGNLQTVGRTETTATDSALTNNQATISTTVSAPPPSGGGGGGGGGGGTSSLLWLLALAVLRIVRSYARPRRFRISGVGPSNATIGTLPTYFRSRKPTGVV